ncbi:MAG: NlpC/P60 family protein [Lachnospiraceae bacterium]|nr:NlpC/P60 family protein [Lachnospiraceae bacterium]
MKYRKLLIFLIAASLVSQNGGYTVFAQEADAAVSVSSSVEDSTASEAEDSTVNPAEPGGSGTQDSTVSGDGTESSTSSDSTGSEGSESSGQGTDSTGTESGNSEVVDPENSSGTESTDPAASGSDSTGTESGTENSENTESSTESTAEPGGLITVPGEESAAENPEAPAAGTESTTESAAEAVAEDPNALPVEEVPPIEETTPEQIEEEQKEEEPDLTPEWHPEWQGRGAEFEIHPFRLIFPVYVRTSKQIFVYDSKEAAESHEVAKIGKGAYIRLIEGDAQEIVKAEAEVQRERIAGEETTGEAWEEAVGAAGEESVEETEESAPMWVYVEAMDAEGNICRGYTDGNNLETARSFNNDLSKVEILKSREENGAFYDNYLTSYRSLRDENPVSDERIELVNYGLQFLGNPYVWGGTSLTEGCDCSGFAGGVYRHFGYDLPRCSYEMCYVSEKMNPYEAQPGDLLFFANAERVNHVMICLSNEGDGTLLVVEAKGRKWGIVVSRVRCERIVWAISILDKENGKDDKKVVEGKQILQKPAKQLA